MKKFTLIAAVAAITMAPQAQAEEFPYWYLGLDAGINQQMDGDIGTAKADYSNGVGVSGSLGYRFLETSAAVELELGYDNSDVDNGVGEIRNNFAAINGIIDLPTGSSISPYIGAGVGIANVSADNVTVGGVSVDGDDTVGMYQGMVGLSYKPSIMPRTEWDLGYRYQGTFGQPSVNGNDIEYRNHSIEVGAEFNF